MDILESLRIFLKNKKQSLWDKKNLFSSTKESKLEKGPYHQISDGILEIIHSNGSHCANALLLNKNGLFVTCNHCLEFGHRKLHLKSLNGCVYEIDGIIAGDAKKDIALGIANTHSGPEEMKYKVFTSFYKKEEDLKIKISLLSLRDGVLTVKDGTTSLLTKRVIIQEKIDDRFIEANLSCLPGDSGGIFIDSNLGILGIQSSSNQNRNLSHMIPWKTILRFIKNFA